ncbi:MAG: hypothetical protein ABIS67_01350 [Candidatus Eisenbacteria bacterium]
MAAVLILGSLSAFPALAARTPADSASTKSARGTNSAGLQDAGSRRSPRVETTAREADVHIAVVTDDETISRPHRVVVFGPKILVDDGELVRLFSDVTIPDGERVDGDVVTVFGSSSIDGHVTGNAIAVFGSVTLGPRASVDGDLVAIFGVVNRAEGGSVGGETVDLGFAPLIPGLTPLPTILLFAGLFWIFSLIGGAIISLVMPARLIRITATASRRMGGSLLLGLAALPMLITGVVLLCITVIGIPVAILLPVAFGFLMWIGQYAGLYGLGLKLLRRRLGEGSVFAGLATGTLFVAAFFAGGALLAGPEGLPRTFALFLVAVGCLISLALQLIGLGAVLLSRFGTRPRDSAPAESPVAATVPQPAAPPVGA